MSALQAQVIESIDGLPDENLLFLLNMINQFMRPQKVACETKENKIGGIKIGMFKGETYVAEGYDFNQDNDQIASWFEEIA